MALLRNFLELFLIRVIDKVFTHPLKAKKCISGPENDKFVAYIPKIGYKYRSDEHV